MKFAVWAAGPPAGRAEDEFRSARVRRIQDGREYARLTIGQVTQIKGLENVAEMLRFEGWADVLVLQEGA